MKRIVTLLAALAFLAACDKDDSGQLTGAITPKAGQYVYTDKTITAAVDLDGSSTVGITIFENGRYVYQCLNGLVSVSAGTAQQYDFDGLVLICGFTTATDFTATVDNNVTGVALPGSMRFGYSTAVLDANGDGVLDSWQ